MFPALGAAVLLAVIEGAGGDFGSWSTGQTVAVIAAAFLVPAVLSAWVARRQGAVEAIAWAVACAAVQGALVLGVGFLALGLGPE